MTFHSVSSTYQQILYLLPPDSYQYFHPEGTGKDTPPFYSAWFIGGFIDDMMRYFMTMTISSMFIACIALIAVIYKLIL